MKITIIKLADNVFIVNNRFINSLISVLTNYLKSLKNEINVHYYLTATNYAVNIYTHCCSTHRCRQALEKNSFLESF